MSIVDGPKKGLYSNHNYIYNICSGTHIRIVDDDHTFPSKHFQICIENIKKYQMRFYLWARHILQIIKKFIFQEN